MGWKGSNLPSIKRKKPIKVSAHEKIFSPATSSVHIDAWPFFSFSFFKNEIVGFIFNLFSKWVNYFSVIEPRAPSVSIYFRPNSI